MEFKFNLVKWISMCTNFLGIIGFSQLDEVRLSSFEEMDVAKPMLKVPGTLKCKSHLKSRCKAQAQALAKQCAHLFEK